jgi:hypothetical protein
MIAFGADKDGSWPVAGAVAGLVVASCVVVPALRPPPRAVI